MYRVLVVDDEPSICKALCWWLSSEGCVVDSAASGGAGIDLIKQNRYDVLIADLSLPDMDGLQLIRSSREFHPEIVSIIITGNSNPESFLESMRCRVDGYLEKPLNMDSLKSAIKFGMEQKNL